MKYFIKTLWTTEHPILAGIVSFLTTMAISGITFMFYTILFVGI